ncbi:MAG TPA: methylmalonyl-CoA epimerase [Gaiellaceae bacterium]|nr:methylmalonyl-CoA epimerase [Gaiellaceae bacterium]
MGGLAIHHLGVAVEDLDASIVTYKQLFGAALEHRDVVPAQGVEAASLRVGSSRVELLRPLEADSPVGRFLAGRGPGMHHVAFAVQNLPAELDRLRRDGVRLIDDEPRVGLFGLQVAFVHPEATGGVLAELVSDGS